MPGLPLALILSIALWALIVQLAVGLTMLVDGPAAVAALAEVAAVAPAVVAAAMP